MSIISGIATGVTSIFIKDKKARRNLLIASGVQLGLGVAIGVSSEPQKKFKTRKPQTRLKFVNQ